jgi:hypothetical protein
MLKSLILLFYLLLHPVYVSLTSVDYAPEVGSLKVFVKLYLDDFLLDAEQDENNFLFSDESTSKEIIESYINKKLVIKTDNRTLIGKVDSFEISGDEVRVYMEHKISRRPSELLVQNLIMTNLYEGQANFVIIKIDNFEEGFKFTPEITEQVFKIGK